MPSKGQNSMKRNQGSDPGMSHHEDPYSEVRDMPNKSKTYRTEKFEMDGFGKKARKGVDPTEAQESRAHDVDAEESN